MALINQPFPVPGSPVTDAQGNITRPWRDMVQSLWTRTGEAPGISTGVVQGQAATAQATASSAQTTANTATTAAATAQAAADASLKIASNLSDLASTLTARNNLGLGPIATSATATGWTPAAGTLSRVAVNGSFSQAVSVGYVQAEVQAISDQVTALSKALAALITDQITVKTIGP